MPALKQEGDWHRPYVYSWRRWPYWQTNPIRPARKQPELLAVDLSACLKIKDQSYLITGTYFPTLTLCFACAFNASWQRVQELKHIQTRTVAFECVWINGRTENREIKISRQKSKHLSTMWLSSHIVLNTFAASYLNTQGLNNSCLKSPASTLVDLTFQSRALRSFSLNHLRNLSL